MRTSQLILSNTTMIKKSDWNLGIVKVTWKSGGYSAASIYMDGAGNPWLAPSNWVSPGLLENHFDSITKLEPIDIEEGSIKEIKKTEEKPLISKSLKEEILSVFYFIAAFSAFNAEWVDEGCYAKVQVTDKRQEVIRISTLDGIKLKRLLKEKAILDKFN